MATLIWIAFLILVLGSYGLWRGFSRDVCISLMLIACGLAGAALVIIGTTSALLIAGAVVIASLAVGLIEGQRDMRKSARARRARTVAKPPVETFYALWQGGIRARRAPRQGATPRKRSRHSL